MKPRKAINRPLGPSEYEFHRVGRRPIRGRIEETGIGLGGRTAGHSERVVVEIERKGRRRGVPLAEKTFANPLLGKYLMPKTIFVLNELRKLGLSAIPTARLAVEKSKQLEALRQIMTDLTRGGKYRVVDYIGFLGMTPEVERLSNLKEIEVQMQREEQIAAEHGFRFEGREWLIIIDPKTNTGKPCIADVKTIDINEKLEKKYYAWMDKMGLF